MKVFNAYARYYDLLYANKDYLGEAAFVDRLLRQHGASGGDLLELGCGTGKHAVELGRLGWNVTGVDLSDAMVAQAQARCAQLEAPLRNSLRFQSGDVRTVRAGRRFDSVISLFHVLSYQTTNADLQAEITTAADHLRPGGLFLFDFWYGPAVLSDPPAVRVKRMQDADLEVTRLAEPEVLSEHNMVIVNYHVFLRDRGSGEVSEVRESHPMRYLFLPELDYLLSAGGFDLLTSGAWCSDRPAGPDSWYAHAIARRRPVQS
jgi:SAM-dependent methyltransferase